MTCSFGQRAQHDLELQVSMTGSSTPRGQQKQRLALKIGYLMLGMTLPVHQMISEWVKA